MIRHSDDDEAKNELKTVKLVENKINLSYFFNIYFSIYTYVFRRYFSYLGKNLLS